MVRAAREESDERVAEEAADVIYHLAVLLRGRGLSLPMPSGCSMAVASGADTTPAGFTPSLAETRALAADYNLIPVRETFIDDCQTPVSAFLKLRGAEPSFLLESADQGRVGRYSFIGFRPRKVLALVAGRRRRSVRPRGRRARPGQGRAAARPAAVRRRRRRAVRLRPRPYGRAARRAEPRPDRRARPGADADRRAGRVRPPQAHGHGDRQRLRATTTSTPRTPGRSRRSPRCAGGWRARSRGPRGRRPAIGRSRRCSPT